MLPGVEPMPTNLIERKNKLLSNALFSFGSTAVGAKLVEYAVVKLGCPSAAAVNTST